LAATTLEVEVAPFAVAQPLGNERQLSADCVEKVRCWSGREAL